MYTYIDNHLHYMYNEQVVYGIMSILRDFEGGRIMVKQLEELAKKYGWKEVIEVFPALDYEIVDSTFVDVICQRIKFTERDGEALTELIQYMADVAKYKKVRFISLGRFWEDLLNLAPMYELPEIIRILVDEFHYDETFWWRNVTRRIDIQLSFGWFEGVEPELYLKWCAMFECGYDCILRNLPQLMRSGTVGLETLRYLGIPDKVISENVLN